MQKPLSIHHREDGVPDDLRHGFLKTYTSDLCRLSFHSFLYRILRNHRYFLLHGMKNTALCSGTDRWSVKCQTLAESPCGILPPEISVDHPIQIPLLHPEILYQGILWSVSIRGWFLFSPDHFSPETLPYLPGSHHSPSPARISLHLPLLR